MSNDALAIRGFTDAIAEALAIRQRFRRGHAAAILDDAGTILDLTVFTARDHSMHDALHWASCIASTDDRATRMVLLSAVTTSVRAPREGDLEMLRRARAVLGERGVSVVDWIQTDGDDIRSLACTLGIDTWGSAALTRGSRRRHGPCLHGHGVCH
ncbi:MAG TPA: hypothetical protein VF152_02120 [Acidimicrobiia bacterium]